MATIENPDSGARDAAPIAAALPALPAADEYELLRVGAGLLDRSERGKLAVVGDDGAEFLNGQLSNEIEALAPGGGCYATLLTPKGRMLADVRVLAPPPPFEGLWLDTERVALQALFDALRSHRIGFGAELRKHTLEYGLLSLVGPRADDVLGEPIPGADEHANVARAIAGVDALAVRTDLGIDVFCEAASLPAVRAELERAGAVAVADAAVECLRIERGRPRYGLDMDATTMPQEAGIHERAVSYAKGCYVGQETVARLYWKGKPNRHLRGLRLSAVIAPGSELRQDDQPVGRIGSVALSPRLGPVALALVRREVAAGAELAVSGGAARATVVELPIEP